MIIFSHAKWGQFKLTLACYPSVSVNHTIVHGGSSSAVRQAKDGIDAILKCTTVTATALEPVEINRTSYNLAAQVNLQPSFTNVWWSTTMTEKAKAKLDDDPTLNAELLASVAANLDALRQGALRAYQRRVLEMVGHLKDNADAIERAVMLPELIG